MLEAAQIDIERRDRRKKFQSASAVELLKAIRSRNRALRRVAGLHPERVGW
jgi:hypothetical protein